jgi:hypothetical protein
MYRHRIHRSGLLCAASYTIHERPGILIAYSIGRSCNAVCGIAAEQDRKNKKAKLILEIARAVIAHCEGGPMAHEWKPKVYRERTMADYQAAVSYSLSPQP